MAICDRSPQTSWTMECSLPQLWGENIVEIEDKSHDKDNDESEELIEDLDNVLDLEFESSVGTDALFHITYAEKNTITKINESIKKIINVVK
ncbi:hypothetical protein TNCV_3859441 [Trichonephila clavipes]|nr:hypothetical protein TNCV_3859441 [Trichonephila clavipes]